MTIILVEHVMDAIRSLCDRCIVMNAGRKIAEGPPAERAGRPGRHARLSGGRPMLEVRGVSVSLRQAPGAVETSSLDGAPGEIVVILGANGAGKSTC